MSIIFLYYAIYTQYVVRMYSGEYLYKKSPPKGELLKKNMKRNYFMSFSSYLFAHLRASSLSKTNSQPLNNLLLLKLTGE